MAARRRPGTSTLAVAIAPVTVLLTLVAGGAAQDGFPFRDFPNPVPYAPLAERPRTFQRDVQHQAYQQQYSSFQSSPFQQHSPFQNKFQSPLRQPFQVDPGAYQLEQKHPYTRNASSFAAFQARPFQTPPPQAVQRPEEAQGAFFPDPHFEHLFQRELNHQIQLEQQRLQEQQQQQQQLQQHQNVPSYQIQQSVQVERPQLQELQELHSLLEQQLEMHEVRHNERLRPQLAQVTQGAPPHSLLEQQQQRQQQEMLQEMIRQHQQQQHNLVDSHELFMSQKIKPQTPPPPPPPRRPSPPQPPPQKQRQTKKPPTTTTTTTTTTTPREPLEVIDLSQFLPFLGQQQQDQLRQQINLAQQVQLQQQKQQAQPGKGKPQPQEGVREQQRLRQQQRQQETLRQQEERRLQEERQRERQRQLRQLRQQALQQQQRQQEQEKRQNKAQQQLTGGAGRQQRQQPTNNKINNNSNKINNNNTGNQATAEKPVTSVRDLFNTSSCIEPPLTCPHPRIHFYLYTRTTQAEGQKVDVTKPESLINTQFNPKHPIKLLIHGFQGGRQFSPSIDLRKAYFIRGDYNIFVVDYNSLVRLPCLSQIQWSPSFLALCVSQLLTYVDNTTAGVTGSRVPPDRFHLIGYSIGAHIAGLVANYIDRDQGKLGRITGLDPTIIFYQGANRSQDLDPSDAHFIDVIHTGAGILGQRGPNGHVDYYVNGGTTQPGCQSDSLIKTLSCDHTKVSPYYVESIVTPVGFWALPCPNLFMYLLGFCQPKDEDYIIMGEDAPHTARGIYYLSTNGNKPYAKGFPGKKMPIKFPKWRPN